MAPTEGPQRNEIIIANNSAMRVVESNIPWTSNMEAPIMMISGHEGEVYCGKFHRAGNILASSRMIAILPELGSLLPMTILVFVTGRSSVSMRARLSRSS